MKDAHLFHSVRKGAVALSSRRFSRQLLCGVALLGLGGCLMVGPKYHPPKDWAPPHYDLHNGSNQASKEAVKGNARGPHGANAAPEDKTNEKASPASVVTELPMADAWWKTFHDAELTSLEGRVATQNLSFLLATQNLAQSRAQMIIAGAERFPNLSAYGTYVRSQHSSKQLQEIFKRVGKGFPDLPSQEANFLQGSQEAQVPLLNQWQDKIDATYEIDLWGRVAYQYRAAKYLMKMSEEERRSILIARQADMARDYLQLRGDQKRQRILADSHATVQNLLSLAQSRYKSGLVTELDVDSMQARLHGIEAQQANLDETVAREQNAIALLLGMPPQSLNEELGRTADVPVVPPFVPAGLPSELAHRRPDIREAEEHLRETVAEVGEATADFYPKVTVTADFGFQTLSFRDLGFWNARAWNVGPSISLPIFQGGRLYGQLRLKKAEQRAAAVEYRQTVLQAWNEVDNALQAYHDEQIHHEGLAKTVDDEKRALTLATSQYRAGLATYLSVLEAQEKLQESQLDLAASDSAFATDMARLYNALGGGWSEALPDEEQVSQAARQAAP
ncbi:efflux transporter outer membrane subunit [Bombella intestini]|uniref:efflux transporter outer membrane subunit n=1 Tax=Bombella intestini TaxID=1539051 RepID=UPI001F4DE692|nr:efflux transporter outer membrane subunit [Bombella intestini]